MIDIKSFKNRCQTAEQCLPASPFRDQLKKLHDEMLAAINLQAAQQVPNDVVRVIAETCRLTAARYRDENMGAYASVAEDVERAILAMIQESKA